MATFVIKRFSQENQEKKGHALRNTLIGAGALAGGLYAGKKGVFGKTAQSYINKGQNYMQGKWNSLRGKTPNVSNAAAAAPTNTGVTLYKK